MYVTIDYKEIVSIYNCLFQYFGFASAPCYFSPLSEIPGSINLLEKSLTYEGGEKLQSVCINFGTFQITI